MKENDANHAQEEYIKPPLKKICKEITQRSSRDLVQEAVKKALRKKSEKDFNNLKESIRDLSNQEREKLFQDSARKISRQIYEGKIRDKDLIEEISRTLDESLGCSNHPWRGFFRKIVSIILIGALIIIIPHIYDLFSDEKDKSPILGVNPPSLEFQAIQGQPTEPMSFGIENLGGGTLSWSLKPVEEWISLSRYEGSDDAWITVSVDESLSPGYHEGTIIAESSGGRRKIPVGLNVETGPFLGVNPPSLEFQAIQGQPTDPMSFGIENLGGGTLSWSLKPVEEWISLSRYEGSDDARITVSVDESLSPGYHEGTIIAESSGGRREIPVGLNVEPGPFLGVNPSSLEFQAIQGQPTDPMSLGIENLGGGTLSWSLKPTEEWIRLSRYEGSDDARITVSVDESLSPGYHEGTIIAESSGGRREIPVGLNVEPGPFLGVNPSSLEFQAIQGQPTDPMSFGIENLGGGTLSWSLKPTEEWIRLSRYEGSDDARITVSVDESLSPGYHEGTIIAESKGGRREIPVGLNVEPGPFLGVNPSSLEFQAIQGQPTDPMSFGIENLGGGTLSWSLKPTEEWIRLSRYEGSDDARITVSVDESLSPGYHEGTIIAESKGGRREIPVGLNVIAEPVVPSHATEVD